MLNKRLTDLIDSLKESYFSTPLDKRFIPGCHTKEYVEKAKNKIQSIDAWFLYEDPDTANDWADENLPNWEGSREQIIAFAQFTEQFILKYNNDDRFVTDELLYRGCMNFMENSYFIELLEFFNINKFLASTEIKSDSLMALMIKGYNVSLTSCSLTECWDSPKRRERFSKLFVIER
mgnify:CR=1 FL=1